MTNTPDNRTRILQRILNLRARAEEGSGATEAEVMTCLDMAGRLMDDHRVNEADLAMAEARGEIRIEIVHKSTESLMVGGNGSRWQATRFCLNDISRYTRTQYILLNGDGVAEFTGDSIDVELAIFLSNTIRDAVWSEFAAWRRGQTHVGRGAKSSFQYNMAMRINERLAVLIREQARTEKAAIKAEAERLSMDVASLQQTLTVENLPALTSRELVMVVHEKLRAEATEQAYRQRHPNVRYSSWSQSARNGNAGAAGRAAGDRVNLGRPLAGHRTRMIQ